MNRTLIELYHKHVAAGSDRQMRLSDFLEENAPGANWGYNVPTAALTFGPTVRFDAPLLGSQAEEDGTWLWAWSNRHLNLPDTNRELATAVRKLAKKTGVAAFDADDFVEAHELLGDDLAGVASHIFALVIAGELGYDAYYTIPYTGGRAAALIWDERLRVAEPFPAIRIPSQFTQAICNFLIPDHRAAFVPYVEWYGLQPKSDAGVVTAYQNGKMILKAEFDGENRLLNVNATIHPRQ